MCSSNGCKAGFLESLRDGIPFRKACIDGDLLTFPLFGSL